MSKQITTPELAEIVTGLLVAPDLMGELCDQEAYVGFVEAIGQVVADHCGGTINGTNSDIEDGLGVTLSVSPSDSLPSLNDNVWSCYDPQGWEGEQLEDVEEGEPFTKVAIAKTRSMLQSLLIRKALQRGERVSFSRVVHDWRMAENEDLESPGDEFPYVMTVELQGDQSWFDLTAIDESNGVSIGLEVDRGQPHFFAAGVHSDDPLFHARSTDSQLQIEPDDWTTQLTEVAGSNAQQQTLVIEHPVAA
jgi:hypothetical protein